MKNGNGNGHDLPFAPIPKGSDLPKLLRQNNSLLLELLNQIVTMNASLEVIMCYLPACASPERDKDEIKAAVERVIEARVFQDKRLRKKARQALKKRAS